MKSQIFNNLCPKELKILEASRFSMGQIRLGGKGNYKKTLCSFLKSYSMSGLIKGNTFGHCIKTEGNIPFEMKP